MVRLTFRGAVGVLWAALATACLGGQTGQPSAATCDTSQVSATAAWSGTTVQAAARAFEGAYAAGLRWQVEPRAAVTHTAVDLQDSIQLSITYGGVTATRDCVDQLKVPVSVTLTTSASGLADSGDATLAIQRSSEGFVGTLHYESKLVRLDATLREIAAGGAPLASFDALDPQLPGASANFTEAP